MDDQKVNNIDLDDIPDTEHHEDCQENTENKPKKRKVRNANQMERTRLYLVRRYRLHEDQVYEDDVFGALKIYENSSLHCKIDKPNAKQENSIENKLETEKLDEFLENTENKPKKKKKKMPMPNNKKRPGNI